MEIVFVSGGKLRKPGLFKKEGDTIVPLVYFTKPQSAKESEYNAVIAFIKQTLENTMKK